MTASVETAWVKPPFEITGLDHLGVQAPCIQIYGQLLPGITNVSDRARYYSFYPWLLNEFEKRGWRKSDVIIDKLRKADCLFSLISLQHGRSHKDFGEHAGSAVGSNTLLPALDKLVTGSVLRLSDYTRLEDGLDDRYFKNPYGGLGQYYFGVLWQLRLMSGGSVALAKIIKETGVPLANAMESGVLGEDFFRVIEADEVSPESLDQLSSFCHCQLLNSKKEVDLLVDIFREGWSALTGESPDMDTPEGRADTTSRARSLALFVFLSGVSAKQNQTLTINQFRGMIYSLCDPAGQTMVMSDELLESANLWQVYQRNEVLSVAMQGLFFALLRGAELSERRFHTTTELSTWFWQEGPGALVLQNEDSVTLGDFISQRCNALPAFNSWLNEDHEIQLMEGIVTLTHQPSVTNVDLSRIASNCLDMLGAVCGREENAAGYGPVVFRLGYLEPYPVNLISVQSDVANVLASQSLIMACTRFTSKYCLDSHLRVAMRKLRQQGQNTSRFEVGDNGIVIKGIPPAAHTSPRFNQSIRILRDLGLLTVKENVLIPSDKGLAFLEAVS